MFKSKKIWMLPALLLSLFTAKGAWALPAATTLAQACAHISGTLAADTFRTECMALSQDNPYFNPNAVGACARLQDNGLGNLIIYPCLVAVRNRTYSDDQISYCDGVQDESSTLACLHSTGAASNGNATTNANVQVSVGALTQELNYAIGSIQNYQAQSAVDSLNKAIKDLAAAKNVSCQ